MSWLWLGVGWAAISGVAAVLIGKGIRRMDPAPTNESPRPAPRRREMPIMPQAAVDRIFAEIVAVSLHDIGTFHG